MNTGRNKVANAIEHVKNNKCMEKIPCAKTSQMLEMCVVKCVKVQGA